MSNMRLLNSKVSGRELRRHFQSESALIQEQLTPAVKQLLQNDRVSQAKITAIEQQLTACRAWTFTQRLRWLIRGTV